LTPVNWGKKTGKGIYDWSKGRPEIDLSKAKEDFDPTVFTALQVNEATKLLEEGVVKSPEEIDKAMINGGGVAAGPFQLAEQIGFDKLARICDELAKKFNIKVFRPTGTLRSGRLPYVPPPLPKGHRIVEGASTEKLAPLIFVVEAGES
jgi:enoyl-CoA hydratase/3-hydroxyacyl-CoA dehydrogenase